MQRDSRIDTIRGIAIVLIVAAHTVMSYRGITFQPQALLGGTHFVRPWNLETLSVDLAYAIALPMFGFVTGLTLHHSRRRGWDLIRARALGLLVPYLAWLALGTGLVALRSGLAAAPHNVLMGLVSAGGRGSLWFLYALFVCVCVFAACRTDRALIVSAALAPLLMAALAFESVDWFELRDAAWLYAPLVAGYLVVKHRPKRLLVPSAAVTAVTFPLVAQLSPWGLTFARLPVLPGQLLLSFTRVACAVAGCILIYALVRGIAAMAWVGMRTLGIYALHPLVIQVMKPRLPDALWLTALIALLVSIIITLAIEQVPWARAVLLGRRERRAARPAERRSGRDAEPVVWWPTPDSHEADTEASE